MREETTLIRVVQSSISCLPDNNSLGIEVTAVWLVGYVTNMTLMSSNIEPELSIAIMHYQ